MLAGAFDGDFSPIRLTKRLMYRLNRSDADLLREAQDLAAAQFARTFQQRFDLTEEFALSFLAREILRVHRKGERDPQRLASKAIGLLREHVQKWESAHRVARPEDPD